MHYRTRGRQTHHSRIEEDVSVLRSIESFSLHAGGLLVNRLVLKMAFGFVNVFVPILLYHLFGIRLLGIYILISLIIFLLTPISASLLSRFGVRALIAVSIPFAAMALWALSLNDISPGIAGTLFAVFYAIHHALYWVPYHVDFVHSLGKHHRGAVLGWYEDLLELVTIATPLIGSILIVLTGFSDTLLFVSLLCLMSLFPVYYVHDVYERFNWTYLETFSRLFNRKHRDILIGYGADGAQLAVMTILWPIFLFELLNERYVAVGVVTTATMLVILVLNMAIGFLIDKFGPERLVRWGIVLSMTGWVLKAFVGNPMQVFMVDTYHKFGDSVMRLSRNVTGFSSAADSGHYVDEYTTIAEMAYQLGKILMLILAGVIINFYDIRVVFFVTGLVSLFLIVFRHRLAFNHGR
jgi:Major Facilitator Superfamily